MSSEEYSTIIIPLDERQQEILDQKAREGWQLVPGIPPIGIWVVRRVIEHLIETRGMGRMVIDEDKIFILRNGKLLDKHDNEVSPERARELGIEI